MKLILLIFSLGYTTLFSQETIDVRFNEANPIWVHTMVDTSFIPISNQEFFTKFSSLQPHLAQREKDYIYLMATCFEKQSLDDFGFVLDKIDIRTGNKIWSHYNTPYNQGQKDIYHNLYFIDENIEMVGAVEDSEEKYYCSHKIIDTKTGGLLKYNRSPKLLPEFYTRYFAGHVISSDSLLLNAFTIGDDIGSLENPKYTYGINIELYDKNMLNLNETRNLFDFDTLGPFSVDQPNYTLRLNRTTLISLAYKDRYESWDNLGTKMMWTDISNPFSIKTIRIRDFKDIVPATKQSFTLQRFNAINNTIHLSHNYPNFDIQKNTCYILWLDSVGEIKSFITIPKYGEHIYQFADMFYANDKFAYLFAFPSVTKKQGFDIIRIDSGKDSINFVSSLTVKNEGEEFGTLIHSLYEDGYLIFGGLVKKVGQESKSSTKFFCFKAADLGIDFDPVATSEFESKEEFSIFPNPTSNTLFLKLTNLPRNSRIAIYNQIGKLVFTENLDQVFNYIDISSLNKGVYYINLTDVKGEKIGKTEKIVKVE